MRIKEVTNTLVIRSDCDLLPIYIEGHLKQTVGFENGFDTVVLPGSAFAWQVEHNSSRPLLDVSYEFAEIDPEGIVSKRVLWQGEPEHNRMRDVAQLVIRLFQIRWLRKLVNGSDVALRSEEIGKKRVAIGAEVNNSFVSRRSRA